MLYSSVGKYPVGYTTMFLIKITQRNSLKLENNIRSALSELFLKIEKLLKNKSY